MTERLQTAAEAANEREISVSRMRSLIAEHGIPAVARQPGRNGANLYSSGALSTIPAPQRQGARNDLLGARLGVLFAVALELAQRQEALLEHSKIYDQCLKGDPRCVAMLLDAARRWAKRPPQPVELLSQIENLASQVGDLPSVLPVSVRFAMVAACIATWELPTENPKETQ